MFGAICIENSDFVEGIFAQIPPSPEGGRSGGPRARRGARGDFSNPRTDEGDLAKISETKSEFCTYFFLFVTTNPNITYVFKSKDYQPSTFQLQTVQQTDS